MKKYYTNTEVCRILNVTRETLRFYEKTGLIHPVINKENNYRLYDEYQIYLIAECRRYQQNEFSIKEIGEMLREDSLEQYTGRILEKKDYFQRQKEEYEKKLDLINEYASKLQEISQNLNVPEVISFDDVLLAPQKSSVSSDRQAVHYMIERLHLTFMMIYMHDECIESGFGIYRKFVNDSEETSKLHCIRGGRAVHMFMDVPDVLSLNTDIRKPLLDYAASNNLTPRGDFMMIQLVKIGEEKDMHRYFEAYLPLTDD